MLRIWILYKWLMHDLQSPRVLIDNYFHFHNVGLFECEKHKKFFFFPFSYSSFLLSFTILVFLTMCFTCGIVFQATKFLKKSIFLSKKQTCWVYFVLMYQWWAYKSRIKNKDSFWSKNKYFFLIQHLKSVS